MRVISWNCYRGDIHTKVEALSPLSPDIVCLQECSAQAAVQEQVVSSQRNKQQGIAIWASDRYSISHSTVTSEAPNHIKASIITSQEKDAVSFEVVGIWAHPEPTYTQSLKATLEANADAIRKSPTIVLGDFNSNACFNAKNKPYYTHTDLVEDLAQLGLVSAYHTYHGCEHGCEPDPTYYWRWQAENPFHLDYCFVPEAWTGKIAAVEVPSFQQFKNSDHRPLIVDISL